MLKHTDYIYAQLEETNANPFLFNMYERLILESKQLTPAQSGGLTKTIYRALANDFPDEKEAFDDARAAAVQKYGDPKDKGQKKRYSSGTTVNRAVVQMVKVLDNEDDTFFTPPDKGDAPVSIKEARKFVKDFWPQLRAHRRARYLNANKDARANSFGVARQENGIAPATASVSG